MWNKWAGEYTDPDEEILDFARDDIVDLGKEGVISDIDSGCSWALTAEGILVIYGRGRLLNYDWDDYDVGGSTRPGWERDGEPCEAVRGVQICNSLFNVPAGLFSNHADMFFVFEDSKERLPELERLEQYPNLRWVTIAESVSVIGRLAFARCHALRVVVFKGDAPEICRNSFLEVSALVFYPRNNRTWTADDMQDYGGHLEWLAY